MASTLNLSLTDELRAFVDENSGDGSLYATPSEFMRDILREKKQRMEAAKIRDAVLDGFQDLIKGQHVEYQGSVRDLIQQTKSERSS